MNNTEIATTLDDTDREEPVMLLYRRAVNEYGFRWFGQKLPKDAIPFGNVTAMGEIHLMSNETLPVSLEEEVLVLFGVNGRWMKNMSPIERSELIYAELEKAPSRRRGPWAYKVSSGLTLEQIEKIHTERIGNITLPKSDVLTQADDFHPLDLLAWLIGNYDKLTAEEWNDFVHFRSAGGFKVAWLRGIRSVEGQSVCCKLIKDAAALRQSRASK